MRLLKSILRWCLGVQALIMSIETVRTIVRLVHPRYHVSPVRQGLVAALVALLSLTFSMAWFTTRRPRATRNPWAIAASVLYIAEGLAYFQFLYRYIHSREAGIVPLAIGICGVFVFSRRETVEAVNAAKKPASIAGDRTSIWSRRAVNWLSGIAQIAAVTFLSRWAHAHHIPHGRGLVPIVIIVSCALLVVTLVHECGHALLALHYRMGMLSFRAGPLHWRKRQGRWEFKFHLAGLWEISGGVGAVVIDPQRPRGEEIRMILAGPVANLALGVVALWAALRGHPFYYGMSWDFVAYVALFSFIAAVFNLVPFRSEEGSYSDGARILQILTKSPLDDYHRVSASIASTVLTQRRPRDLDIAAIERVAGLFPAEMRGLHLQLCAGHYYEDSGRLPEAKASLAAAESMYNNGGIALPGQLHTCFVIGHAHLNRDAAAARRWWDRMQAAKNVDRTTFDYHLSEAVLSGIEGRRQDAEAAWQKAEAVTQRSPHFGTYEFDRERCARVRKDLTNPAPALAPPVPTRVVRPPAPVTAPHIQPDTEERWDPLKLIRAAASLERVGTDPA